MKIKRKDLEELLSSGVINQAELDRKVEKGEIVIVEPKTRSTNDPFKQAIEKLLLKEAKNNPEFKKLAQEAYENGKIFSIAYKFSTKITDENHKQYKTYISCANKMKRMFDLQ